LISGAAIDATHQAGIVQPTVLSAQEAFAGSNKKIRQQIFLADALMTVLRQVSLARAAQYLVVYAEISGEFAAVGAQDEVRGIRHDLGLADTPALAVVIFRHRNPQGSGVDDRSRPQSVYSDSLRP
jgi:hypothetical protein